ncbi:SRPBCC family protein [Kitasatospora mediocidica]|uniref:SRPBCC family protein n=1 Tax=Kitasatospora mediocidica TaxID=58352 RepID=UPI0005662E4B|nr:SRPBCC family protein [Kitasatospora mediocidica]
MSGIRSTRLRAALITVPLVLGVLGTAVAPAGAAAAHPRPSITCRGAGVDPGAVVRYRTQTMIHAPLDTVWKLQTDVERWPSWQAAVNTAQRLDHGPLRTGSAFRWTTPVPATATTPAVTVVVTSTVEQIRRDSCIRWTGPATAGGLLINGVHVWNFTQVKGGVLVRTEETHAGAQVDADPTAATRILAAGLDAWLRDLKAAAEARSGDQPLDRR